jgi:hypothetical protein
MGFIRTLFLAVLLASSTVHGQDAVPPARTILDLSDADQIAFIRRTMELGFPTNRSDQMTMLIINRSALALPLIEAKMEEALKAVPPQTAFVETASEMIAYAGDKTALMEISKLLALDENRFGRLVGRTLDNAGNWRNPFNVAYDGLAIGDSAISRRTMQWVESASASNRMQRAWADALLDRYGRVPGDVEWATDPVASQLRDRVSAELRKRIVSLAEDAQRKRERK